MQNDAANKNTDVPFKTQAELIQVGAGIAAKVQSEGLSDECETAHVQTPSLHGGQNNWCISPIDSHLSHGLMVFDGILMCCALGEHLWHCATGNGRSGFLFSYSCLLTWKMSKWQCWQKKRLRGGQTLADSTLVVAVETLKVGKCLVSTFTFTPHTSITAWLNKGLKNQWRSSKQQKTTNQMILRSKCHVVAQVSVTTP